jgi:hypothetical protein
VARAVYLALLLACAGCRDWDGLFPDAGSSGGGAGSPGALRWAKGFGSPGPDEGRSIAFDGDAVVVGGSYQNVDAPAGAMDIGTQVLEPKGFGDGFVARLVRDKDAATWAASLASDRQDFVRGVAVLPDGDAVAAGSFQKDTLLGDIAIGTHGSSLANTVVFRMSPVGVPVAAQQSRFSGHDWVRALATDAGGGIFLGAQYTANLNGGTELDDGLVLPNALDRDVFVARYPADLPECTECTVEFATALGNVDGVGGAGGDGGGAAMDLEDCGGLAADGEGGVYVTGRFQNELVPAELGALQTTAVDGDAFLVHLGPDGGVDSARQLFALTMAEGVGVARAGSHIALAVRFKDQMKLDSRTLVEHLGGPSPESLVVVYDAKAEQAVAHYRFAVAEKDGTDDVSIHAIAANATHVIVAGSFSGSMVLDGSPTTPSMGRDAFVAKLDLDGKLLWTRTFGTTSDDVAFGVAVDEAGRIAVTGAFRGSMTIDGTDLQAVGDADVFVAVFDP